MQLVLEVVYSPTCKEFSKVRLMPFQRVNSPLWAPQMTLLPSGTHEVQNIGQRTLLETARTNLVVTELTGDSNSPWGSTSSE